MTQLPSPEELPRLFIEYEWDMLHAAFGWPADRCENGFAWMISLENRFVETIAEGKPPDVSLVIDMILWGGNQNNILARFSQGLRQGCDHEALIMDVLTSLDRPSDAIEAATRLPGIGLTYGSKLLMFCCPARYGALDKRLRQALLGHIPRIHNGNVRSMRRGYGRFLDILYRYQERLASSIERPAYGDRPATTSWTAAEVELALFSWATDLLSKGDRRPM